MRIAIVLPKGFLFCPQNPNSIETVIRTINAPILAENEIMIFSSKGDKQDSVFKTTQLDIDNGINFGKNVLKAVMAFEPDIIEVHQNAKLANLLARKTYIPVCLYRHNYVKPKSGFLKVFQKNIYSKLAAIFFVSAVAKEDFGKNFPNFSNKTYSIGNPIDTEKWPIPTNQKENIIFFAGRAAPEKGLSELCDGLVLALQNHHDWRAILMLNNYETHKKWADCQLAKLSNVESQIKIFKNQPISEVIKQQSKAKIAIVPSKFREPFGLVALEAHALLCALISSGSGGLREASGDNAIYLEKIDGANIYKSIKHLIQNPTTIEKLATEGRSWVEKEHNAEHRAAQLMSLRHGIVNKSF